MLDTSIVIVPMKRYEELLNLETRVKVVVERILHNEFLNKEDILWLLDTEVSVELAQELHEKSKKEQEKWLEEHPME